MRGPTQGLPSSASPFVGALMEMPGRNHCNPSATHIRGHRGFKDGKVSYHIFSSGHASGPSVAQRRLNHNRTCFAYVLFWGTASDVKTAKLSYVACLNFTENQWGFVAVWNEENGIQKRVQIFSCAPASLNLLSLPYYTLCAFVFSPPCQPQFSAYKSPLTTIRPCMISSLSRSVKIRLTPSTSALF